MKKIRLILQKISLSENSGYVALLAASFLGFGVMIPRLGFYMDDWPYVFYAFNKGIPSLQEMLAYDSRPHAAWLYMFGFYILGFKPASWHLMSLLLRLGIAVSTWKLFRAIWPDRNKEALQIALIFLLYPFFLMTPAPIAYTHIWFGFLSTILSFLLMVHAYNSKKYKAIFLTIVALLLEVVHLFTGEYFSGLEFVRVAILWNLANSGESSLSQKTARVFLNWLPYAVVLGLFTYWRIVLYKNPVGIFRNSPVVLQQIFTDPIKTIFLLINTSLRDALSVLTIGWQKAVTAEVLSFLSPFAFFRLGLAFIGFVLVYFYLSHLRQTVEHTNNNWKQGSLILAISSLLVGGLPIWLLGRSIAESNNIVSASRFGIATTFGASIFIFLIIDYLIAERKKVVFFSCLIALAINFQLNNAKLFEHSWEKQQAFSQQLIWRAPTLKSGTAILTDEEIIGFMGDYAISFSAAASYQSKDIHNTVPYWYFPFYYTNPDVTELLQGVQLQADKLSMHFEGNSKDMILVSFNPELNRCLWILQPQDQDLRLVSEDMRRLSPGSNINLIQENSGLETSLPEQIYGGQNTKTWCYYFQKADLARQYSRWKDILKLWDEANLAKLHANNGYEYIPFIEAFGHEGNWEQVAYLTKSADKITASLEPSLCSMLERLSTGTPRSEERDNTIKKLKENLKCENYQ